MAYEDYPEKLRMLREAQALEQQTRFRFIRFRQTVGLLHLAYVIGAGPTATNVLVWVLCSFVIGKGVQTLWVNRALDPSIKAIEERFPGTWGN